MVQIPEVCMESRPSKPISPDHPREPDYGRPLAGWGAAPRLPQPRRRDPAQARCPPGTGQRPSPIACPRPGNSLRPWPASCREPRDLHPAGTEAASERRRRPQHHRGLHRHAGGGADGETPLLVELAPLDRHLRISRDDALHRPARRQPGAGPQPGPRDPQPAREACAAQHSCWNGACRTKH